MRLIKPRRAGTERGGATIEALLSFTAFLFLIFTILNIIRFCRVQALISNAVDSAAKELSQYSYFYQVSGLKKFGDNVAEIRKNGATKLDGAIGTVDKLYQGLAGAAKDAGKAVNTISSDIAEVDISVVKDSKDALQKLKSDGSNIMASMSSVSEAFKDIGSNPMAYIKSIIAVAGSEGLDLLKSHAIAAPISKQLVIKHFGSDRASADAKLKNLGVVDGLDGLNFNMSKLFPYSPESEREDIHIIVYYRVKIVQIFGWIEFDAVLCKEARVRAWLGGDDVIVKVDPQITSADPANENEDEEGEYGEDPQSPDNDGSATTGLWALPKRSDDGYYEVQNTEFKKLLGDTYGFEANTNSFLQGQKGKTAYGCWNVTDGDSLLHGMGEYETSWIAERAYFSAINSLKTLEDNYDPERPLDGFNYKPGQIENIVYVIYVPENIPDSVLEDIQNKSNKGSEKFLAESTEKLGREVTVDIQFVKAGGNYDYGSSGEGNP